MSSTPIPEPRDEDFVSIELHLSFVNMTTKTTVQDGKKYIGEQLQVSDDGRAGITLVEFRESGLVIEVPARSGAVGHQLNLKIWTEGARPEAQVQCVVTITAVEKLSPLRDQFELEFNEVDSSAWKELQAVFQKRQEEIFEFMKAARGW